MLFFFSYNHPLTLLAAGAIAGVPAGMYVELVTKDYYLNSYLSKRNIKNNHKI